MEDQETGRAMPGHEKLLQFLVGNSALNFNESSLIPPSLPRVSLL